MIKTLFKDLFNFIKKPDDTQSNFSIGRKLACVLIFWGVEILFTFLIISPLFEAIDGYLNIREAFDNKYISLTGWILVGVIGIPFFEELLFRYFLRYKGFTAKLMSRDRWNRIFPFLVYGLSICFGLVHMSNYRNSGYLFFVLSPLIVLSQLVGGIILSFIRVRFNFIWGVLYHTLWNFFAIVILPFLYLASAEPYNETTSNYSITIKEQPFFDNEDPQYVKIDSTAGKIKTVDVEQIYLQHLLDTLYTKDKYYAGEALINLNFKSDIGVNKEEFLKILQEEYDIE